MYPLLSPSRVADLLGRLGFTLLDATLAFPGPSPSITPREAYLARHLSGAMYFDIEELSDKTTPLPHMLPSAEAFSLAMARLGVSSDDTIVVYEQGDVFAAPRARWMLQNFGAQEVFILDGGLRAWVEAGLPVQAGTVERALGVFAAALDLKTVCSLREVEANLARPGQTPSAQIIDARSTGRFRGTAPEPRANFRSGHMPGAVNVPYTDLIEGGRMRSPEALRAVFAREGVDWHKPVITTCGSGVTAAVVALALEMCGADRVSLYDGSWAEYAQQPGATIEGAAS